MGCAGERGIATGQEGDCLVPATSVGGISGLGVKPGVGSKPEVAEVNPMKSLTSFPLPLPFICARMSARECGAAGGAATMSCAAEAAAAVAVCAAAVNGGPRSGAKA
eukprot:7285090-Pyramimonas_sp.AAC.1